MSPQQHAHGWGARPMPDLLPGEKDGFGRIHTPKQARAEAPLTLPPAVNTPQKNARALSPSQALNWLQCSFAWYAKHELGLPDPPTSALAIGTAIHATAAHALTSDRLPDLEELTNDVMAPVLCEQLGQARLTPDEQTQQGLNAIHERGSRMVAVLYHDVLPALQRSRVNSQAEAPFVADWEGVRVRGIADHITPNTITELKTSSRKPGEINPRHRFQALTYAALSGRSEARIITIHASSRSAGATTHTIQASADDARMVRSTYAAIAAQMDAAIVAPNRTAPFCSRTFCSFWQECEREWGGRVPD